MKTPLVGAIFKIQAKKKRGSTSHQGYSLLFGLYNRDECNEFQRKEKSFF